MMDERLDVTLYKLLEENGVKYWLYEIVDVDRKQEYTDNNVCAIVIGYMDSYGYILGLVLSSKNLKEMTDEEILLSGNVSVSQCKTGIPLEEFIEKGTNLNVVQLH